MKFDTFTGVFLPTLLTILGVIMYVRLPWVVGNAGVLGAWGIMALALGISACTGLSLSSIASNTRMGAGGPFAVISNALGVEIGGSIGIPLYLSRPMGTAMYVFGFREGWLWFFPDHDPLIVDLVVFGLCFGLSFISANLAFRVQFIVLAVIVASLVSIFVSPIGIPALGDITWVGEFPGFPEEGFQGIGFWTVFAIFFPATTGILAGANMSGDLRDPRRAIPRGTLWAILVATVIYFVLSVWVASAATNDELVSNYYVLIDKAFWPPAVLAGLLGATFSSALASQVGGPRVLMAMAQADLLPGSGWLARATRRGEPRNAVVLTGILTLGFLMLRDLNAVAPLVTMFFLITYFMINIVLFVEGELDLISFRPSLRVSKAIPLMGATGSLFTMFVINPTFSLVSVGIVVGIYVWMHKRGVEQTEDDVRSGIFVAVAEWAAARVVKLGETNTRAWKPSFLVPFENADEIRGELTLLSDFTLPEGSVKLLGLATSENSDALQGDTRALVEAFERRDVFTTWSIVESQDFSQGVMHGLQALQGAFFRPNLLFLRLPDDESRYGEFGRLIVQAHENGVGVFMLGMHPHAGLGERRVVNLWIRRARTSWDVDEAFEQNNLDLTLLTGARLLRTWGAEINVVTGVADDSEREAGQRFVDEVCDLARIPEEAGRHVLVGNIDACIQQAPRADLEVMGLQSTPDFDFMNRMVQSARATCLFVTDSGRESARV